MNIVNLFDKQANSNHKNCTDCLILSYDENGNIQCRSDIKDKARLLLLVETFRQSLLNGDLDGN